MAPKLQKKSSFSHGIQVKNAAASKSKKVVKSKLKKADTKSATPAGDTKMAAKGSPWQGFNKPMANDVVALHRHLAGIFGERRPSQGRQRRDIMDTVVGTILSQNTTNTNSHAAFASLKQKFKTWDAVRTAKPKAVQEAIKRGGLAPKKTKFIQDICNALYKDHGKVSMEYLRKLSKEEVHASLGKFVGLGKKTIAIINLFDLGHPDMAVDTHVYRYAEQLGWMPSEKQREAHNAKAKSSKERWPVVTRDSCYAHLDALFPDEVKYSMHLILTDTTGGLPTVCTARDELSWKDGKAFVNGVPLRQALKEKGL